VCALALDKETKTLREAVQAVLEQSSAIADAMLQMNAKIHEQVVKVLDEFGKQKDAAKKALQADGAKLTAGVHAKIGAAKKAEQAYQLAHKTFVKAKEDADKAVSGAGDDAKKKAAADKLVKKADELKAKAKAAEEPYRKAVKEANDERHTYLTQSMPKVLEAFQKLHHERWEQVISVLKFYTSALSALPDATETAIAALKDKVETQASWDEDLQEFVDHAKEKAGAANELEELKIDIADLGDGAASSPAPAAAAAAPAAAASPASPAPASAAAAASPAKSDAAAPAEVAVDEE
jgi:hypothetical protein